MDYNDPNGYVAQTQCDHCGALIPLTKAVVTTHHITPTVTEVEHYCSDAHALDAWRKRHYQPGVRTDSIGVYDE